MVQVFFVMLFFPVVMNALQYYIIDSFIKDQKPSDHGPTQSEEEDEGSIEEHVRTGRQRSRAEDHDGALGSDVGSENVKDPAEITVSEGKGKPMLKVDPKKLDEYDPAIDGERSGSSGERESLPSTSNEAKAKNQSAHAKES